MINQTHGSSLTSWVESANGPATDFPIQNLPHGVFRRRGSAEGFRGGVAIGEMILDMRAACAAGAFHGECAAAAEAAGRETLNGLMAMGPPAWSALRARLSQVLREGAAQEAMLRSCLVAQAEAEYAVPAQIGDYTDFFTSWHHMVNAGRIFQPDRPELPNFKWQPLAYHGRSSSVAISGTDVRRPQGQWRAPGGAEPPVFAPTERLDYEMELGFYVGMGNPLAQPIPIDRAESHIFGVCLLNDWSARDVQAWESLPLGPFLAKNFTTTVSPWVVTLEALAPYRSALTRGPADPLSLPHLRLPHGHAPPAFDIELSVGLRTQRSGGRAFQLSRSNFRHCYWALAQMLAHHAEGGCNLRPGDLMGTGTQSGPGEQEQGCLLELSQGGRVPVQLESGESRCFLEDGDTVVMQGWCERKGFARIGFGECSGTVLPALP
jgi:fumarylacetoacetase